MEMERWKSKSKSKSKDISNVKKIMMWRTAKQFFFSNNNKLKTEENNISINFNLKKMQHKKIYLKKNEISQVTKQHVSTQKKIYFSLPENPLVFINCE